MYCDVTVSSLCWRHDDDVLGDDDDDDNGDDDFEQMEGEGGSSVSRTFPELALVAP